MNKHALQKLFGLFLLLFLFSTTNVFAQENRITINLENASLRELFKAIEKQTTYRFSYRDAVIDTLSNITISKEDATVSAILDEALVKRNLKFNIVSSKSIVISDKPELPENNTNQSRKVTGIIQDTNGDPIIGATIREEGTNNGVISDVEGNFSINVGLNSTINISYIGYVEQNITTSGKNFFNIILNEDSKILDEIVVIGYGSLKKKDLTGAISHIDAGKLAKERPPTVQDMLRSAAPGLNIGISNDAKGGGNFRIRGERSLKGNNDPLFVLNGSIFQGELSEINPIDIESIDVLKDASSAAVYGAKSANGVVIITTKKGKEGKPTIRFDASVGFATMGINRDVYAPSQYLDYRSDYALSAYGGGVSGNKGYYSKPTAENLSKYNITEEQWKNYDAIGQGSSNMEDAWLQRIGLGEQERENYFAGKTYDWYKGSFQAGLKQDYNVSISGKTDKLSYYWSLGYLDSEGVVVGDEFKNYRTNLRLDANITDFLEAGVSLNLQSRNEGGRPVDWREQLKNSPYSLPYNSDGSLNPYPMGEKQPQGNVRGVNSLYHNSMSSKSEGTQNVTSNFYLKVKLPFNISYQFSYAPRYSWYQKRIWNSSQSVFDEKNGEASRKSVRSIDWTLDNMIKWNYTLAKKHSFDVTLLQSAEKYEIWSEEMYGSNFTPSDVLEWHNMQTAVDKKLESGDTVHTGDALMARLFYSYDNRYMLTASVRRDGFSAFGKSNPRATFPSIALAWNFANENFFNWTPMSSGKLRLSWGKNGNRDIGIYQALSQLYGGADGKYTYVTPNGTLYEVSSLQIERLANHDLKWESTTSWNVGLDFGFLNNRLNGSVEWYYMPTTDLLMDRSLPDITGYINIITNLGKVVNQGFEISLNSLNIDKRNFSWNTTLGISHNKNEIKHLYYQYEDVIDKDGNVVGQKEVDDVNRSWFVGKDIHTIWDYKFIGIWQENEAEEAAKYGQKPGDAKALDVNEDYKITQEDKVFLGNKTPKLRLSLKNDFTLFNDWNISFNLYSYLGHKQATVDYLNYFDFAGDYLNTYIIDYWTPENQSNKYARLKSTLPSNVKPQKAVDKSFIRLENISVSYNLPKKIAAKLKSQNINLYATVRNVAVWTFDNEWDNWDPEYWDHDKKENGGGPVPRTFTFGASITF